MQLDGPLSLRNFVLKEGDVNWLKVSQKYSGICSSGTVLMVD